MEIITDEFKTSLMGGYNKEDVDEKVNALREEHKNEIAKLNNEIESLKKAINDKDEIIADKNNEIDKLQKDIKEKYQGYIDNYDTIGKIVYDAKVSSERALQGAKAEGDRILAEAESKAKVIIDQAVIEGEKRAEDGKKRLYGMQDEINELLQLVNKVQHQFMQSFKAIHEISGFMTGIEELNIDTEDSDQ